jgi:hypothetical protein
MAQGCVSRQRRDVSVLPGVQPEAEDHFVAWPMAMGGGGDQPAVEQYVDPGAAVGLGDDVLAESAGRGAGDDVAEPRLARSTEAIGPMTWLHKEGRRMRRRYLQPLILTIGLLTLAAVFVAPAARATILVDLLTGLAWPLTLLVAVIVFWPQLQALTSEIVTRTQQGASLQLGIVSVSSLPELAARIPTPATTEPVSLENIALLHTSFVRPDKTREFDDGRTYYQFEVIVIAPDAVLRRVTSVRYELENAWPPDRRVQIVTDRPSRFKLKELANGTSIVKARIDLHGQDHALLLNRFIDLRPTGPRL